MPAATVFLAGEKWFVPVLCGIAGALILVLWSYVRSSGPAPLRVGCAVLKFLGFAALLLCLLEPMWSRERAKPGANVFAVIADNSRSMTLRDEGAPRSRGDELRETLLGERSGWRPTLAASFEVRNYLADSRLRPTEAFGELTLDGRASALGDALRQITTRHRGQPLAGAILLTDGIAGDLTDLAMLEGLPPVYPVIFGSDKSGRDAAISNTAVTLTSFDDAPVTVQADVSVAGMAGEELVARLLPVEPGAGKDAKPVAEETLKVPAGAGKVVFRLQFRPEKTGVAFYRLVVGAKAGDSRPEATNANNEAIVTVNRGGGPFRILYVAGRPNWEYKFLRRAIDADEQVQLVGLIRIAKREPKFEFRGRAGESSNPLFRGFGNQSKEEVERYDKPVLVRLGTENEAELIGGFPKTPEDLFRYRAVIVDDVEAEFFTADQMSLLQRFVSERGGGFLMLGGAESFSDGKYARTAVGEMLPVYLDARATDPPGELKWSLTREGWLQPWVRLRTSEAEERKRLAAQPHFDVWNHGNGVKPAASVLATVTDGEKERPALVTQRFGRGRSGAMLVGDFWQAGLGDEQGQKDIGRAWRQILRWLVSDVPGITEVRAEPRADGQSVKIEVRARTPGFEPVENASVSLKIQRAGVTGADAVIELPAEASTTEPGLYTAEYFPRESGGYRVTAAVKNETGAGAGTAETGWSTNMDGSEFRSLVPNRALMEEIAKRTGGEVVSPERLEALIRKMPEKRAPVNETITEPLWHTAWVFLIALTFFLGEWGLRRRFGLA
jgi:uncharacterized membrane protein